MFRDSLVLTGGTSVLISRADRGIELAQCPYLLEWDIRRRLVFQLCRYFSAYSCLYTAKLPLHGLHYMIRLEPELPLQFLEGSRSAESIHADNILGFADISLPAEGGSLFHGNSRFHFRGRTLFR